MRVLAALLALAGPSLATAQDLMLEEVGQIDFPTSVVQAPGDDDRLFVTSQPRGVFVIENGVTLETPFLDVEVEAAAAGGLHGFGVSSVAFHPDYESNGRFYVAYLDQMLDAHVAEYTVSSTDPNAADPSTRIQILGPHRKSFQNHGLNHLWFGPDGMLYVNLGDDERTQKSELNNAQDLSKIDGSILRLDVDAPPPYVPADNPFVGTVGVDERIFAYGFRQPWRSDHDPVAGRIYVADVGHFDFEEISSVPFAELAGANFGWRCLEGTTCTNLATGCPLGCADPNRVDPVHEYAHTDGLCAVIGGAVYRGTDIPSLQGRFLFADFCTRRVWSLGDDGQGNFDLAEHTDGLASAAGVTLAVPTSFGTDQRGEVYVCDHGNRVIWKIVPRPPITTYCATSPNSVGAGAMIGHTGSNSVSNADLALTASGAPANAFGFFYYGRADTNLPLGNGFRCVDSGGLWYFRFMPAMMADGDGNSVHAIDFDAPPAGQGPGRLLPGATWHFQYWYRDPDAGGARFNLSDGLRVTFAP